MHVWHERLLEHGFDTVSLTAYARQYAWDSADLRFAPPEDSATHRELRAARAAGLRAVLVVRLELEHAHPRNRFLWHGSVVPRDDAALAAWFERYGELVRGWAEIAEREGVELFGIGSELTALTSTAAIEELPELEQYYLDGDKQARERARLLDASGTVATEHLAAGWGETFDRFDTFLDERAAAQAAWARQVTGGGDVAWLASRRRLLERHWRELVADVRELYSGRVTYAANFDQYRAVGFWDALDVLSINGYFPLRSAFEPEEDPQALEPQLRVSWERILREIDAFRRERDLQHMPVVFTELGYTPRAGATIQPWAGTGFAALGGESGEAGGEGDPTPSPQLVVWPEQPYQPRERAVAIRALAAAARQAPDLLHGLLWWKLSTVPGHREIEPFVVILGERGEAEDPVLPELRALAGR
ncbi:MAG TPA: hypothetical protein VNB06_08100 [Thermoanaerobaculia bacterium]|nr:hypothetical protein [Thermoanaerobaculia bacterium]